MEPLKNPLLHLQLLLLTGWAAIPGLVAVWAARSRWFWFWRALAACGAVGSMMLIRAWAAACLTTGTTVLVFFAVTLGMHWQQKPVGNQSDQSNRVRAVPREGAPRFSVQDLMLAVLLIGLMLPGLTVAFRHGNSLPVNWFSLGITSLAFGILTLVSFYVISGPRRLLASCALLAAVPASTAAIGKMGDFTNHSIVRIQDQLEVQLNTSFSGSEWLVLLVAAIYFVLIQMAFHVFLIKFNLRWLGQTNWRLRIGVGLLAIPLSIFTALLVWFYAQLLERPQVVTLHPVNNRYDRIVAIANRTEVINPRNVSIGQLQVAAPQGTAHQEMKQLYQELLPLLESTNAVIYDPEINATVDYPVKMNFRSLARSLIAESDASLAASNTEDAAEYAIAIIRLGAMSGRGGLFCDWLIGGGLEYAGYEQLAKLRFNLSPQQRRVLISALENVGSEREPISQMLSREADYEERAFGFWSRVILVFAKAGMTTLPYKDWPQEAHQWESERLLLQTELAIGLYEQERGQLPTRLDDLVTEYVSRIPIDPYSRRPLNFVPAGDAYKLYSVGRDGHDDGGNVVGWNRYQNETSGVDFGIASFILPDG